MLAPDGGGFLEYVRKGEQTPGWKAANHQQGRAGVKEGQSWCNLITNQHDNSGGLLEASEEEGIPGFREWRGGAGRSWKSQDKKIGLVPATPGTKQKAALQLRSWEIENLRIGNLWACAELIGLV